MKQLRPYLGVSLAIWLGYSAAAMAQGEFYIELRGPESAQPARADAPATVQQSTNPGPASVQPVASPGRYGPIRSTDTLWAIAARYTRAPTTVQQTMVAMYHLNPQAFVRGNINYLQRGAQLRLPTVTQARQRSAREAEAEFRRLSRQGSRSNARVAAAQTPSTPKPVVAATPPAQPEAKPAKPAVPVVQSAPVAATPPGSVSPTSEAQTAASANGLSEPRAASVPVVSSPDQAEKAALNRLQLQLMDELREQVAMSNEQLASLADNNQALRQRLTQLTAEVEDLKASRLAEPLNAQDNKLDEVKTEKTGWLSELFNSPLNLALILILPALLLLALFTLWWRNRERRNLAEQEQELSETSAMLDDERDEFEDLFATESDDISPTDKPDDNIPEQDVDEDAFARFLEEQQLLEEQEAQRLQPTPEENQEPDLSDALFEDATQFDDAAQVNGDEQTDDDQPVSNDDIEDLFGELPTTADNEAAALDEDALFDDEARLTEGEGAVSNDDIDDIDDLLSDTAVTASEADVPDNFSQMDDTEQATTTAAAGTAEDAYVSVDKLMADAELGEGPDPELERKLDLELDDYANVIGQGDGVDIDADEGGIGAQLDLARAYIEIDDIDSARELLNEAIERGNEAQQRDAQKLLQRLAKLG